MAETLVERLRAAERFKENVEHIKVHHVLANLESYRNSIRQLQDFLARYHLAPLDIPSPATSVIDLPHLDVADAQKRMIEEARGNPYVERAIVDGKSIEAEVLSLAHTVRGWRRYLPHKPDARHNQKVEELEQLFPIDYRMKMNFGRWHPKNSMVSGAVSCTAMLTGGASVVLGLQNLLIPDDRTTSHERMIMMIIAGAFGAIGGGLQGAATVPWKEYVNKNLEDARYLDGKVKELYARPGTDIRTTSPAHS